MIHRIKAFIQVLKESRHPVKMLLAQILAKTGLNRFFKIQMNGYKIRFSKSALAITFFANSAERHDDEDFLKRVLKPGEVYADVGANIGTLVLSASTLVGSNGKVIGIEPHPATFKYLQANVDLNGFKNISIINAAVGNKKGRVSFSNINSEMLIIPFN